MTTEEFERIVHQSRRSDLSFGDWLSYSPRHFADEFLPYVRTLDAKAARVYDGAGLFKDSEKTQRRLYQLTDSKYLIGLITYTYPKGVAAQTYKNRVTVGSNEVCVFIEVAQDDTIEVFFKLGRDFREFLFSCSKQNKLTINPAVVESTAYKTTINDLKTIFNKKVVHYNVMEFVLKTIGVDEAKTFQNNYTLKLNRLLRANKIRKVKYTNVFGNDEKKQKQTIVIAPTENEGSDLSLENGKQTIDLDKSQSSIAFLYEGAQNYVVHESAETKPYTTAPEIINDNGKPAIDNELVKQIHGYAQKTGLSDAPKPPQQEQAEFSFADFVQQLNEQAQKTFYQNIKLQIRVVQLSESATSNLQPVDQAKTAQLKQPPQVTNKALIQNYEDWDVGLDVIIDEKGKVSVKHRVSPTYLKESKYWGQEIKLRGLDEEIKLEDLRQQIATDFVAPETENSFSQKFLAAVEEIKQIPAVQKALQKVSVAEQKISAATTKAVVAYVEGVQATQKVAKNVWEEGTINESLWLTKDPEYKEWPEYMHINPVVGGATDGVIDEIIGIPMAVKSLYDLYIDEQKRNALFSLFSDGNFGKLIEGIQKEARETLQDIDKCGHFAGQASVATYAMFFPFGPFTKIGKLDDALGVLKKSLNEITNPKVAKLLKNLREAERYSKEILDAIENFLRQIDPKLLDKLADAPGFEKVIKDMAQNWNKFTGGKFVLEYASKMIADGKIIKFEVSTLSDEVRRIYDIAYEIIENGRNVTKYLELKSWSGFFPDTIKTQFVKDLENMEFLGSHLWIFSKKGINQDIDKLRESVLKALKKSDGTPIDELGSLFIDTRIKEKLKSIFREEVDTPSKLLDELNKPEKFNQIFEIVE